MRNPIRQQIIISGVGGQGVLFITRLLAETAILKRLSVFTSETHGMAQRGGTVVSHLKVGSFSSPLIRPQAADGLLALHAENVRQHGAYVKPGGWLVANSSGDIRSEAPVCAFTLDATKIAQKIGAPRSVNLVALGFTIARISRLSSNQTDMFFSKADVISILKNRLANNKQMLDASLKAIEAGYGE